MVSAAWVLEGRAIQDVFAVPGLFYGTSLRFYDPNIDAWQVFWIDPLKSVFFRMIGRAQNNEIVNEAKKRRNLHELTACLSIRARRCDGFLPRSRPIRSTGAQNGRPTESAGRSSANILRAASQAER